MGIKDDSLRGSQDLLDNLPLKGVQHPGNGLMITDVFTWIRQSPENSPASGMHIGQILILQHMADITAVALIPDQSHTGEKPENGGLRAAGAFLINPAVGVGVRVSTGLGLWITT